jgi:hypothetical protein
MELLEVVKYLRDNGYLLVTKGRYSLSSKFARDKEVAEGHTSKKLDVSNAWDSRYLQFIKDAEVPAKIETSRGEYFVGNGYTEPAMEVFKQAITSGRVEYDILVKSTKLYYRSGAKWKKKVSNYLVDGDWYSDYINLVSAMKHQTEDSYIKTVQENGPIDQWSY